MREEKLVSIVLPVFNGEHYLAQSIESVINQTYTNWELIIVDDCSTDKTLEIADGYRKKDSRIKVYSNDKNLKLPGSLNKGFERANGEYYTWTSDDNIYKSTAIEELVSGLEENDGNAMVYSNYTNIDSDGRIINEVILEPSRLMVGGNVFGASFLYRADVAEKVGQYDENLFLAEDYDYWIRISSYGKVVHLDNNLFFYRRHGDSLTEKRKNEINYQTYKALEKNFFYLYFVAKNEGLERMLFEHMLARIPNELREELLYKIYEISPRYATYCFLRRCKHILVGIKKR